MEPSAEWQLTDTAVMVYADADAAGGGNLIVGVADSTVVPHLATSSRAGGWRSTSAQRRSTSSAPT